MRSEHEANEALAASPVPALRPVRRPVPRKAAGRLTWPAGWFWVGYAAALVVGAIAYLR